MSGTTQRNLWMFLAILCAIGTTVLLLSYMVTAPQHMMTDLGGDTGKNYFSFIYHAAYDHGLWFRGMNYPYGDHIIYADGQPILSTALNSFTHVSPRQALGIMNLLIAFSYVLAIVYTYRILLRFGVHPLLAILFACLINVTAPQVMRARSHFALAYLCVVPMLFYYTLMYHRTHRWLYILYIFLLGFAGSFIHLYFGAIILLWLVFYMLACLFFSGRPLPERFRQVWPVAAAVLGIFLCIKIGVAATDPITDRPALPYNGLDYVTHIKDLITSPYVPQWQYIKEQKIFTRISEPGSEGYSYPGIVVLIVLIITIPQLLWRKWKTRGQNIDGPEASFPFIWLFMAFCALLLCMGVPFIWHLKGLLNYLSLFRQFRSFGRFSWIFYYIVCIYTVVVIYEWYVRKKSTGKFSAAYTVLVLCLLVWGIEASGYITYTRGYMAANKGDADRFFHANDLTWEQYLAQQHHAITDFQGIISLPFTATGSEKIWVGEMPGPSLAFAMSAATQTRLPIVDFNMSRTSWSVTEKQVKTVGGPYTEKPMLDELSGDKPLLLLHCNFEKISCDEAYLLSASDFIGHQFDCDIYAFYPARLLALDKKLHDSMLVLLPLVHGDTCIRNTGPWYVNHYDDHKAIPRFFGPGAAGPVKETEKIIATIPIRPKYDSQVYELSCWFLVTDQDFRSPGITIQVRDSSGAIIDSADALTKYSVDNDKLWFRDARYFALPARCRWVSLKILNDPNPAYIAMDELMLRPADAVILSASPDGKAMVNNHVLR